MQHKGSVYAMDFIVFSFLIISMLNGRELGFLYRYNIVSKALNPEKIDAAPL